MIPQPLASLWEVILITIAMICRYLVFAGDCPQEFVYVFLDSVNVVLLLPISQMAVKDLKTERTCLRALSLSPGPLGCSECPETVRSEMRRHRHSNTKLRTLCTRPVWIPFTPQPSYSRSAHSLVLLAVLAQFFQLRVNFLLFSTANKAKLRRHPLMC